jgi:hypothetical protein
MCFIGKYVRQYFFAAASLLFILSGGCGKKDKPVDSPGNVDAGVISNSVVRAPLVFDEKDQQARFENVFYTILPAFSQPTPGMPVRIIKNSGGRIEGELASITTNGIMITAEDNLVSIDKMEMDEATRATFFAEDFGRNIAEQRVLSAASQGQSDTLEAIFLSSGSLKVKEVRRFSTDKMAARYGPGRHFAEIVGTELYRGQSVHVVDEKNGWIKIKSNAEAPVSLGWIPRFSTFVPNPENKEAIEREVKSLLESGFIIDVNPKKNEVWVDMYEWKISDKATIEGKSRVIAYYCGQQKKSRLYWVSIKDALNGRKLAEYSESKGFTVY